MTTKKSEEGSAQDDGKTLARTQDSLDPLRGTILATGEFYLGLAEAMAEAFRSFNVELRADGVAKNGLTCGFIEGLAQGNVRFFEAMAKSSRRTFDAMRPKDSKTNDIAQEIDYERLAKLVAIELRRLDTTK